MLFDQIIFKYQGLFFRLRQYCPDAVDALNQISDRRPFVASLNKVISDTVSEVSRFAYVQYPAFAVSHQIDSRVCREIVQEFFVNQHEFIHGTGIVPVETY